MSTFLRGFDDKFKRHSDKVSSGLRTAVIHANFIIIIIIIIITIYLLSRNQHVFVLNVIL